MAKTEYNRIKEVMASKGIKQTWMAERLGLTFRQFNSYTNNHSQPSIEMLYRIASILQVPALDLLVDADKIFADDFVAK